ncbi:MAG TPA: hypothetical protein VHY22_15850 [Chthoniobacteraceae bacterium]|jgi:hypothetical protein|nr:hypothetical protein [Chthoniobacteraceae bacterium]
MPLESLHRELARIGQLLNRWQAELLGCAGLALGGGLLWLGGFSDLYMKWGAVGRIGFWLLMVAALAGCAWQAARALAQRRSREGVAACIERAFPQLDNRLINLIQFGAVGAPGPLRSAYILQGVPNWGEVNPAAMRDWRNQRRAWIGLGAAALLLLAPFLWNGATWGNALARILNPFSSRPPITIAHILEVTPGDGTCVAGNSLAISLTASGRAGQQVSLDLWPAGERSSSVSLGQLSGHGSEDFSYMAPKVADNLDYRVRAGDAESAVFHIRATPPLAYSRIDVTVTPPPGIAAATSQKLNALTDQVAVPAGSRLSFILSGNRPFARSFMAEAGLPAIDFATADQGATFTGSVKITKDTVLCATGVLDNGENVTALIHVSVTPDMPPVIRIISPQGHGLLGPGASPVIQFEATDDFGLTKVSIEKVDPNAAGDAPGKMLQQWDATGHRAFPMAWTGDGFRPPEGQTACFRVVALDNYAGDAPHRTVSPMIVFQTVDPRDLSTAAVKMAAETQAALDRLVAMQTENLARTRGFTGREQAVPAAQWSAALDEQQQIHDITGTLISDPRKPLASLQQKIEPLYSHEMQETVALLQGAPTADAASRPGIVAQAVMKEDIILHILTGVDGAFARADRDRRISDLLSLMDALVHDQKQLNTATASTADVSTLSKKQDRLSGDADAFVATALAEAEAMKGADGEFAQLLTEVAHQFGARSIPPDMLRASDALDARSAAKAEPIQARVLKNLEALQASLNSWRAQTAGSRAAEILAAFEKAEDKLRRLAALQEKVIASMKQWKPTEDATTGKESDAHEELEKKDAAMKEALLQIAADLQIFPEAQLGNEVVKDVTTTVAKVDQAPGSEHQLAPERDLQKEDWMLKDIDKMAARIKDGLPTLPNTPTNANFTTEDFDKQEFPGKVAAVPLADKFDDLIGDLLKLDKDIEDKTKSSATNQAFKDNYMEGPVAEGEWANYSAKGKSGNNVPKDNEQSGRSNVGRQGQSDGETAAASGKINQGNDDIHKRMTQDSAQSGEMGKIDDSLAKTVATGGGKLSGVAQDYGMAGNGPRRDSKGGGGDGMAALLKQRADDLYAAATLQHVRTGSLDEAIMHMRDADDAERAGRPIEEVRELRRLAQEDLFKTQAELAGGITSQTAAPTAKSNTQEVAGAADEAPAAYQQMVSDYYKSITDAPQK